MKSCKQIAIEWGLSERTINDLCKKGKIDGAIKVGRMWQIPDDATKPVDGRITSGKYVRQSAGAIGKPLPIGISDYIRAQSEYYYEVELRPFTLTGDSFPKIVVRKDIGKRWYDDNGILNINVIDFLLDRELI